MLETNNPGANLIEQTASVIPYEKGIARLVVNNKQNNAKKWIIGNILQKQKWITDKENSRTFEYQSKIAMPVGNSWQKLGSKFCILEGSLGTTSEIE